VWRIVPHAQPRDRRAMKGVTSKWWQRGQQQLAILGKFVNDLVWALAFLMASESSG